MPIRLQKNRVRLKNFQNTWELDSFAQKRMNNEW